MRKVTQAQAKSVSEVIISGVIYSSLWISLETPKKNNFLLQN